MKRLYKSEADKKISGVLAGIGEYYNTDPTLVRIAYILLDILTGVIPGIIAYVIMAAIMPTKSEVATNGKKG